MSHIRTEGHFDTISVLKASAKYHVEREDPCAQAATLCVMPARRGFDGPNLVIPDNPDLEES